MLLEALHSYVPALPAARSHNWRAAGWGGIAYVYVWMESCDLWASGPDPGPDPAIFVIDLQVVNKKQKQ